MKSWRRRRSRPRISASAARVLPRLQPRGAARESLRCNTTTRRRSPAVSNNRSIRSPSLVAIAAATPRSTPTAAPTTACAAGVLMPSSTRNDTNQCRPSRLTVADRITTSSSGRDIRKRTQPSLGNFTRPWPRLSFSTAILLPSGNRNDGAHRRPERHRTRNVPCSRHARSRSINVCCRQCPGASVSHPCSAFASANSLACGR